MKSTQPPAALRAGPGEPPSHHHPSYHIRIHILLNGWLCGWLCRLGILRRVSLDRLSHWNVCFRVLLHLLALALLRLRAGACWVPIDRALLLLKALVHEAGDEAEGGQEDEEQDDCDHAGALHPFALAAANLQASSSVSTT